MNKNKISLISYMIIISILFVSCTPTKTNCGTKKQHKNRINNSRKMAPSMMN